MLIIVYWPDKDPSAELDYGMSWGPTLGQLGDPPPTIISSNWLVVSGNVTIGANVVDSDGRGTVVRVVGGSDGTEAMLKNIVTLSDGQVIPAYAHVNIRSLI